MGCSWLPSYERGPQSTRGTFGHVVPSPPGTTVPVPAARYRHNRTGPGCPRPKSHFHHFDMFIPTQRSWLGSRALLDLSGLSHCTFLPLAFPSRNQHPPSRVSIKTLKPFKKHRVTCVIQVLSFLLLHILFPCKMPPGSGERAQVGMEIQS